MFSCSHPFTPAKLCAAVEEAKVHAAEYTLQTLGLQSDGAADASCATATAMASVAFPGMWRSVPKPTNFWLKALTDWFLVFTAETKKKHSYQSGFVLQTGYTLANPASSAVASQLKEAGSLGQELTAYATYEGYPAFAVAARHTDGYGVF